MSKLSCEDGSNCSLVIGVMKELHEECVGADTGVLCRVDPYKVMVVDEEWAVRWR